MRFLKPCLPLVALPVLGLAPLATGAVLLPTGITVEIPSGTNDPSSPFTDDVLLDTISFGSKVFTAGEFVPVISLFVSGDRSNMNAEWGDNDTASDGNPDPFTRVGLDPSLQESTDPLIQDLTLASAFSTTSLVEGTDGESGGSSFSMIFGAGIYDSNPLLADAVPEILIFERGNNDTTTVRGIIGGTFDSPVFAPNAVTINPNDMWDTGLLIDTNEISGSQELAAIGIDLSDFGAAPGQAIFGIELATDGGDFYGQVLSPDDPGLLEPAIPPLLINPDANVPEPGGALLSLLGLLWFCRRQRG